MCCHSGRVKCPVLSSPPLEEGRIEDVMTRTVGKKVFKNRKDIKMINLDRVPEIGFELQVSKKHKIKLIGVEPWIRKSDGVETSVLVWQRKDGKIGTSGLKSNGLSYDNDVTKEYENNILVEMKGKDDDED